jgi:hypothetical protein
VTFLIRVPASPPAMYSIANLDVDRTDDRGGAQCESVVAGRLTDHHATAHVSSKPEDQQNNQHKTEQSAAVV